MFAVADPHGRAHTPVADLRDETLESNLLPVSLPDVFWAYEAAVRLPRKVYDLQRESGLDIRNDFTVFGGRLLTWSPVEDTALAGAVNGDPTIEATGELLDGSPDSERVLVRLLNNALRQDLRGDCAFHGKRHMLYFRATDDLSPRKWNTSSTHWRSVFKPHAKKTNPSQVSYYKHAGTRRYQSRRRAMADDPPHPGPHDLLRRRRLLPKHRQRNTANERGAGLQRARRRRDRARRAGHSIEGRPTATPHR